MTLFANFQCFWLLISNPFVDKLIQNWNTHLLNYFFYKNIALILTLSSQISTVKRGNFDRIQGHLCSYWNVNEITDHGVWKYMPRNRYSFQNNLLLTISSKIFWDISFLRLYQSYPVIGVTLIVWTKCKIIHAHCKK